MDEKLVMSGIVRIAMKSLRLGESMHEAGYSNNPYYDLYGFAADVIYYMLGERTNEFAESVTYMVLSSDKITDDQRTDILLYHYRKNRQLSSAV